MDDQLYFLFVKIGPIRQLGEIGRRLLRFLEELQEKMVLGDVY